MKTLLKIIGTLAVALIVVGILASVALRIFLPPAKVKALLLKEVHERLHREVELGAVSVTLLRGLTVSDLKISEEPDFSKGTFVSSQRFVVSIRLLPLLMKKVMLKEVMLDHPVINVVRYADGKTYNFSSLTGSSPAATAVSPTPPATSGSSLPIALLVSRATVKQGVLHFTDASPAQQSIAIDPINLSVKNFSFTSLMDVESQLSAKLKGLAVSLSFVGQAGLDGTVKIKTLTIASGTTKLDIKGSVQALMTDKPTFNVTANLSDLTPALISQIASLPPSVKLPGAISGSFQASGSLADLSLDDFAVTISAIKLSGHGTIHNLSSEQRTLAFHIETNEFPVADALRFVPRDAIPKTVSLSGNAKFSADVSGTTQALHFSKIALDFGHINLEGTAALNTAQTPIYYDANLTSNEFSLSEAAALVPMLAEYKLGGQASTEVKVKSSGGAMDVNGTLNLKQGTVHYEKSDLTQLATTITFGLDDVSIQKMTGKLNGGDLFLSLTAHKLSTHPKINSSIKVAELDLDKILPSPTPTPAPKKATWGFGSVAWAAETAPKGIGSLTMDLTGTLSVAQLKHEYLNAQNLEAKWNLTDVTQDMSKVGGTSTMKVGKGRVQNIQKLVSDSKIAKILLMPVTVLQKLDKSGAVAGKLPSLASLAFDEMTGDYSFKAGVMEVKSFLFNGPQITSTMKGTVGLAGVQPLNLKVIVKLPAGSVGGSVGELFNDEKGRPTLNMSVTGTAASPQTGLDKSSTGQQVIQKLKGDYGKSLLKKFGVNIPGGSSGSSQSSGSSGEPSSGNNSGDSSNSQSNPNSAPADDKQEQIKQLGNVLKGLFNK